ncbi:MAG: xylose isomerase [Phycisphaerae bacterium SM23_33]|jgi:sugar phosphate isomerase/epimerase|nr:MAG: xylose isomerase [Phycisphaerae bacterium SM23_33]
MKLGVMGALFGGMKLDDALDYCAKLGLDAIELPAGCYPGDPWKLSGIHRNKPRLKELKAKLADRGLEAQGVAVHGNPVHPSKRIAAAHAKAHREAVLLAAELGTVVINFSGCPGGAPGEKTPNWVTCPWPDDYTHIADYQWNKVIIPFWKRENDFAARHGVKIAFEAHPGFVVHNPEDIVRLRKAAGKQLGANLDPSHFFWQGIDPVEAARFLGENNCIFHVHAKDCAIDPRNSGITGNLDIKSYGELKTRAWVFRTVGYGHGDAFWKPFVSMLRVYGYDGVISIEHEDSLMSLNEGFEKAVEYLRGVILRQPAGAAWWF